MSASDADPTNPSSPHAETPRPTRMTARPAPFVWGTFFALATILGCVLVYLFVTADRRPRLTRLAFEAAAELWDAHGPADYNLDLQLAGNRPGLIHVEVRGGEAIRMTRDGVEPMQERTWYYWTVPGQMDTIAEELDMAENPAEAFGSPAATQAIQWAEFDPQYGYPLQYDRVVLGTDFEIHWKVIKFEPLSPPEAGKK